MNQLMRLTLTALALFFVFLSGCSVPNLESAECTSARGQLKKLYSIHFDRGFEPDDDYRKERNEFLTKELRERIDATRDIDLLTRTSDHPKAFRIGSCTESGADTLRFGILLFWKDEERNEQRKIEAVMKRTGNEWDLDSVESTSE